MVGEEKLWRSFGAKLGGGGVRVVVVKFRFWETYDMHTLFGRTIGISIP